jgi:capsular polysaccharide transport system permease protein
MVQHFDQRTRAGKLSTIIMIAEPLILLVMFYWVRVVIRGLLVPYGESVLLFLASGLLPFYVFLRGSIQVRSTQLNPRRKLPRVSSMDLFIASSAVNALIWIVVIGTVLFCMWLYGIKQAKPASIADCAIALSLLVLAAAGLGLINTAIGRFLPIWLLIFSYSTRGLLFVSGVLHMPDFYMPTIRWWFAWNPILHGVEWFRLGLYGRYPSLLLDQFYLVKCAVILLFIGIVVDRVTLRYAGR